MAKYLMSILYQVFPKYPISLCQLLPICRLQAFIAMVNVSPPSSTLSSRLVILCFVPYYLPGYRSGGPVRSIANLVDHLADEFDVRIVTLNRDASACQPYPLVDINAWNTVGKAKVFYCAPNLFTYIYFLRIILTSQYDILYLNSFFDIRFSLLPLILRRIVLFLVNLVS